jgi:hypothetical protein
MHYATPFGLQHNYAFGLIMHYAAPFGLQHNYAFGLIMHYAAPFGLQHNYAFGLIMHYATPFGLQHKCPNSDSQLNTAMPCGIKFCNIYSHDFSNCPH